MDGHVARIGEKGNACGVSIGKQERKGPLEGPRCSWEDSNEIALKEMG
jgi:hypothetical protein